MIIKNDDNGKNGVFYAVENDLSRNAIGEMTYYWDNNIMVINYTHVADGHQGQGIGKKLVAKAVEKARMENFKIYPTCRFAKAIFDKTPEYNDVRLIEN